MNFTKKPGVLTPRAALIHRTQCSGYAGAQIVPRFATNVYYNCVSGQVWMVLCCVSESDNEMVYVGAAGHFRLSDEATVVGELQNAPLAFDALGKFFHVRW